MNAPNTLVLSPDFARRIEGGRYWLFNMPCPVEVMAAYERLWASHQRGGMSSARAEHDGALLMAWVVERTLKEGDIELAAKLRKALGRLGWQPPT